MLLQTQRQPRSGAIIPLVAFSLVAMFAFLALAIDIGVLLVSKTQAQNAADAAAMAGARTLNGDATTSPPYNQSKAGTYATAVANLNSVLGQPPGAGELTITIGAYQYDKTQQVFLPQLPTPVTGSITNWSGTANASLVWVTYAPVRGSSFATVIGQGVLTVSVNAMAAHRPRDTCLVLDYSGSMNDESDLWNAAPYLGTNYAQGGVNQTSNNVDTVYPQFGHYSAANASPAMPNLLVTPLTGNPPAQDARIGLSNITTSPPLLGTDPITGKPFPIIAGNASPAGDFFSQPFGQGQQLAFSPVTATQLWVPPAGDQYLFKAGTQTSTPPTNFAATVQDIVGNPTMSMPTSQQWTGYSGFQGFTQGPGYWGDTFFIWPPDPDPTKDWRAKYFLMPDPSQKIPVTDNTVLWDNTPGAFYGDWKDPADKTLSTINYRINYANILSWIKANCIQQSPGDGKPFPPSLHGGEILYYDGVPDDVPSIFYTTTTPLRNTDKSITWDTNQRFWKEYIDFAMGVWLPPVFGFANPGSGPCSLGPDFQWGKVQITAPPQGPTGQLGQVSSESYPQGYTGAVKVTGFATAPGVGQLIQFGKPPTGALYTIMPGSTATSLNLDRPLALAVAGQANITVSNPYMNYLDNPRRPRHRFWFGPMTMVQFLLNYGQMPGTANDVSMGTAKHGVEAALVDIKNNHPNDLVSLILFNRPTLKDDPKGLGSFSQAQVELTNNYNNLINLMYYPPDTNSGQMLGEVRLFDPNDLRWSRSPRASSDFWYDTATDYGLMVAYNQFSGTPYYTDTSQSPPVTLGGGGRTGASRLVILETDGMANVATSTGTVFNPQPAPPQSPNGVNNSFYMIGPTDTVVGDPVPSHAGPAALAVAKTLTNPVNDPSNPGFSTPSKPVNIFCIAFGKIFASPNAEQTSALTFLNQLTNINAPPNGNAQPKTVTIVIGTQKDRETGMKNAFTAIMDSDIPVSLIK
jgi:Flp pilus assembly protein TadG